MTVADATAEFFAELDGRGHEPLFGKARGRIRFDLAEGARTRRWLVTLDEGDVSVSRRNAAADCVVHTTRTVFDAMVRGDVNGMAAYLRNELTFEGDPELLVLVQRVLPGPSSPARR